MIRKMVAIMLLSILFFPFPLNRLSAQTDVPKVELGGFYSLNRTNYYYNSGFGGRFGFNLSEMFTVEADYTSYPQDRYYYGTSGLALFGVKFGARSESAGFFTRFSPGFIRYSNGIKESCLGAMVLPPSCFQPQTRFGFNVGGGFEFFPSRSTYFRFDIGNLWVDDIGGGSNNLLMNVGAGFRF